MKDTLETLVWVDTWTKPMKHQLAGAREAMMRLTSVKHLSLGPCQLHILARGDKGTFLNFHSTLETLEIVPMMKRDDEDLWGRRQRRPKPDQLHLYLLRLYEICALPSSKMRVIDLRSFMPQDVELIRILDSEIDMTIFLLARKFFRALGVLVLFQSLSRSLHYYFMEIFPSEIRPERKTELKAAFSEGDTGVSP
ncbi:hypothetical protein Cob_v009417 [Colletotrichum orbiculare MAFF 240422]|uniref:Uncharacterized protein n=1 Tax=Colletotrichum orbiculare (strain 104-T / ATCC 96160 / CBS 514.97 / LARS 414 / MAFF 240422) TaxID=1213857 RepID=A0A484FGP8_COLOR|nr:hypothetical protein Cob_v009417 [Colletotrichum orbiculare MAFF 240422]